MLTFYAAERDRAFHAGSLEGKRAPRGRHGHRWHRLLRLRSLRSKRELLGTIRGERIAGAVAVAASTMGSKRKEGDRTINSAHE